MTDTPKAPGKLGPSGRVFWREIAGEHDLNAAERAILEQACRILDTIGELADAMKGESLTVRGSAGQLREHPLIAESRQQRALFGRLVGQLKVPATESMEAVRDDELSRKRRDAVGSRYGR